jgi:hypothetical protein
VLYAGRPVHPPGSAVPHRRKPPRRGLLHRSGSFMPGNPYFTEAAGASTAVAHGGLRRCASGFSKSTRRAEGRGATAPLEVPSVVARGVAEGKTRKYLQCLGYKTFVSKIRPKHEYVNITSPTSGNIKSG